MRPALLRLTRGQTESQRVRLVWIALGLVVLASTLERFIALSLIVPHFDHTPMASRDAAEWDYVAVTSRNVIGMGADFAIGAALAFLGMRRPTPAQPRLWYVGSIALGLTFLIVLARWWGGSHRMWLYYWLFADMLGGCSGGALLYGALGGNFERLVQLVSSRAVIHGAELAYAIYLFHYLIIKHAATLLHGSSQTPAAAMVFSILVMLPVLAVAELTHRFIERPGLLLRDKHREPIPALP